MLTMSHTINASDRGGGGGWKTEPYRSSDSVESSEDSDNSSTNSSLNGSRMNSNAPHLPPSPIGCITTHCVSAVIRPERKMPPIDPLQFVKIQKHELSKKAVEQIKLAEEVKITKEKIKEVEEEWQNNLMNWKSKRKLTKTNSEDEALPRNPNRKTKTFSEILNEKARLGARIGYNLHKYIGPEMEDGDELQTKDVLYDSSEPEKSDSNSENEATIHSNMDINGNSNNSNDNNHNNSNGEMNAVRQSNLDRFLNTTTINQNSNNNLVVDADGENISRNGLGEVVVYNTSLLEEFSVKSDNCDNNVNNNNSRPCEKSMIDAVNKNTTGSNPATMARSNNESPQKKVHVPINDWKSSQQNVSRKQSTSTDDDQLPQNSSFENDDEEELDEELEKLRIDQERSFKAKLQTFEILAKQEEEAAKRAAEANRRRIQNRAKLAAERSKSLSNINSQPKHVLGSSNSISSSSLQQNNKESDRCVNKNNRKQPNLVINNEADEDSYYQLFKNAQTNSVVYNFKDKSENSVPEQHQTVVKPQAQQQQPKQPLAQKQQQKIPILKSSTTTTINDNNEQLTKTDNSQKQQMTAMRATPTNNIYENVTSMTAEAPITTATLQTKTFPSTTTIHHQQQSSSSTLSQSEIISDSDAIRNASQKLLQQQQQIYQNQPLIQPIPQPQQFVGQQYPNDNYSNLPPINYGYSPEMLDDNQMMNSGHRGVGYQISDDVGLPPIQITKSIQSIQSSDEQHPVYQNQMMVNPHAYHNYDHSYNPPGMPRREELVGSAYYSQPPPPPPPSEPFQQPHSHQSPHMDQYLNSQCLYYPKPYGGVKNGPNDVVPVSKPIVAKQQQANLHNPARIVPQNPNRYGSNGYNPNHWVIQEAELRQSAQRQMQQQQQQQQQQVLNPIPPASGNKNGYLSVSGKKKCSKCSEELGKGCAAMVVESLSLYYHINCFRCSVCNIQLGNGTVGTDVRVRNQKLHCQNCYSNDEAGLKFSRV